MYLKQDAKQVTSCNVNIPVGECLKVGLFVKKSILPGREKHWHVIEFSFVINYKKPTPFSGTILHK